MTQEAPQKKDSNAAIAPSANQSCEDSSHDLVSNPNNAIKDCGWKQVKGEWKFVGRRIKDDDLLNDLSADNVRKYNDGDLIAAVRLHKDTMRDAIQTFCLTNEDRYVLYEELHVRFKSQHILGEKRNGKPTLRQAFALAGWDYDKARAWHSYWHRTSKSLLKLDAAKRKMLAVADGDVLNVTDEAPDDLDIPQNIDARVKEVSDGGMKVTLVLDANDGTEKEIETPLYDADGLPIFKKVPSGIRTVGTNDLIRFGDDPDGVVYRCTGINGFKLDTKTPSLKQLREAAEKKKKKVKAKTPVKRTDVQLPTSPDGHATPKVRKPRQKKAKATPVVVTKEFCTQKLTNPYPDDPKTYGVFLVGTLEFTRENASFHGNEAECLCEAEARNAKIAADIKAGIAAIASAAAGE
jgi:hypothetical protein